MEHFSGFKPSIILTRGPIRFSEAFLGTHHYTQHRVLLNSSLRAECRASEGLEAERIASLVTQLFSYYENLLEDPVFEIRDIVIERETPIRVSAEHEIMSTTVSLNFVVGHSWNITLSGEILKDIIVTS